MSGVGNWIGSSIKIEVVTFSGLHFLNFPYPLYWYSLKAVIGKEALNRVAVFISLSYRSTLFIFTMVVSICHYSLEKLRILWLRIMVTSHLVRWQSPPFAIRMTLLDCFPGAIFEFTFLNLAVLVLLLVIWGG